MELTDSEKTICLDAKLSTEDGLLLKKLTGQPIEKWEFDKQLFKVEKPQAICSVAKNEDAKKIVLENRDQLIAEGKYIFICATPYYGYKVAILGTTADPFEIMQLSETNGIMYDIEPRQIIEQHKKWDNEFGIKLIAIGFDFCECEIVNKEIDYKKLIDEIYDLCPNVVDEGPETVEEYEEQLKRTGRINLWWE